jgi:hypothetical protein
VGPVTQKSLYTGLFVIGIPLLWLAAPLSTIFWIVGASSVLILGHASMLEPGVVRQTGLNSQNESAVAKPVADLIFCLNTRRANTAQLRQFRDLSSAGMSNHLPHILFFH